MAAITASVFANVLILMVPFDYSTFLSATKVGYEIEFAEIMVSDSKKLYHKKWPVVSLAVNSAVESETRT
jgi:hypothetical protein